MIFDYADGFSQLGDELSTAPVQAGINAASRTTANFVTISSTSNISTTSNVHFPGLWVFQTNPIAKPCKNKDRYMVNTINTFRSIKYT